MERYIEISKFRNIGLNNPDKLVLNYSVKKGELGGLVTIIGPNNAGKSNYLDSLETLTSKSFKENDKTNLSYDVEDFNPKLSFVVKDGKDEYSYGFDINRQEYVKYPRNVDNVNRSFPYSDLELFSQTIKMYIGATNEYYILDNIMNDYETYSKEELFIQVKKIIDSFYSRRQTNPYRNVINYMITQYPNSTITKYLKNDNISEFNILSSVFLEKYGYNFFPKVHRYVETPITSRMLETNSSNVGNNSFFKSLLKAIDMEQADIQNAYEQFNKTRSKGFLDKLAKNINDKLIKLTEQFNKLYYLEKEKYDFKIDLESERIFFKMSRGEDPIVIDCQSTGFRWFFNLYFNFLCLNNLNHGDLIISDEFATCLHPQGQKELRKFIKEFGQANDILFVIATQSPFLADIDNFDELRVVTIKKNIAKMNNSFTTINHNDPDSLLPIKESFTINNHILYDYDTIVVYVEGITDYNYLTMFKNFLDYKNIAFLPIEGVGKNTEERIEIRNKLIALRKHHCILLVDGDKAGQAMVNICKNSALDTISLKDIDVQYKEIENLFSEDDRTKYNLKEKSLGMSSIIKNYYDLEDFDKITVDNFKKVLDYIDNM